MSEREALFDARCEKCGGDLSGAEFCPDGNCQQALPPHEHTIEPGEINRRGCPRCEIEAMRRA